MVTYTAGEVVTIIAAIGVLLTGVGAIIVNVIVAMRSGAKADVAAIKTDGLVNAVKEVHTAVNSNLTALKAELAASRAETVGVKEQMSALHLVIADLQSERNKVTVALTAAPPPVSVIQTNGPTPPKA